MTYYAHINSKNILIDIDMSKIVADEYDSTDVQNIEVDKSFYDNKQKYGIEYYMHKEGEIVKNPEWDNIYLEQKKKEKIEENDKNRDEKLNGGVTYNNVLFESDTDQKINLLATYSTMTDDNTIVWYGKDNQGLLCTKNDLLAIGNLITELHSYCWENNAYIKEQIELAKTQAELDGIDISYNFL